MRESDPLHGVVPTFVTRREMLKNCGTGFGMLSANAAYQTPSNTRMLRPTYGIENAVAPTGCFVEVFNLCAPTKT